MSLIHPHLEGPTTYGVISLIVQSTWFWVCLHNHIYINHKRHNRGFL